MKNHASFVARAVCLLLGLSLLAAQAQAQSTKSSSIQRITKKLAVTVNPSSGPTGTPVKVTVKGAHPGEILSITIATGSYNVTADRNGTVTFPETMNGRVGQTILIKVQGSSNGPPYLQGTGRFKITSAVLRNDLTNRQGPQIRQGAQLQQPATILRRQ